MNSKRVNWSVNSTEAALIERIADRAEPIYERQGVDFDRMAFVMDMTACHCNGHPLDLVALLNAEAFDFTHDIAGIRRHINRKTGKIEDLFVPRFSLREEVPAWEA